MIYLLSFAASVLFAYFANKTENRKNFYIFSICSILVMVLLAGLRDYSIGIDTLNYLNKVYYWKGAIRADSIIAYIKRYFLFGHREPLFALIIGFIAQVFGEFRVFLFFSHSVILTGIYIGAYRLKKYVRPELVLLLFYLFYFNSSLNIIRQYIAMAIVFAFFVDLLERKYIRYIVAVVVAVLIHNTALLAFVPFIIHFALYPKKSIQEPRKNVKIILFATICIVTVLLIPMVKLFMTLGILNSKYNFFLNSEYTRMSFTRLGLHILEISGIILLYKELKEKYKLFDFFVLNSTAFFAFHQMATMILYGQRIAVYFALSNIVMICLLTKTKKEICIFKRNIKLRHVITTAICLLALYYWVYQYVFSLADKTYPYLFGF